MNSAATLMTGYTAARKTSPDFKPLQSLHKTPEISKNAWDNFLTSSFAAPLATTYPYTMELPVKRIWQRTSGITSPKSACGPTTGAMIVKYYIEQNYSLRGSLYYFSDAGLVNHLYSEMGSGTLGTSLSGFYTGILTHMNHDYCFYFRGLSYASAANHYVEYRNAIYENHPVGIRYNYFVSEGSYTNYHFVAGIGYKEYAGTTYFAIKDPDNGQNNTQTIWLNWVNNAPSFGMVLTIPQV